MAGRRRDGGSATSRRGDSALGDEGWSLFWAESEYAESILRCALGDQEGCIAALERSLEALPTYAPAILSLGSVEYQLGRRTKGWRRFRSLFELPDTTPDLAEILDEAGDFLIGIGGYSDGLRLYREAAGRFPEVAALYEGLGCCAGHEGLWDEAIAASRAALALEPDRQEFVNGLGWSLYLADRLEEAREVLQHAVTMDTHDELAAENLRICEQALRARAA
jgi:tetratricopeptide (TPR) repeat protein